MNRTLEPLRQVAGLYIATLQKLLACGISIKPGRLNKTQLKEFAKSGISEEYAHLNFRNITRKHTDALLGVSDNYGRQLYGTALLGGWADVSLTTYKPKQPRVCQGRIAKYDSKKGSTPQLVEVKHPEDVGVNGNTIDVVEGMKKAVATAQRSGNKTYAFNGLMHGLHLKDDISALVAEGVEVRVILDNDNSINAVEEARRLVKGLSPGIKIAQFKGYKGIDDAFMAGIKLENLQWVDASEWIANYSGYLSGDAYTFSAPRFHEVNVPDNKSLVVVRGAKNTGKTHAVETYCKLHPDRVTINGTHRRTLAIANADRLNIPYIEDADYKEGSVALCLNKLEKIKIEDAVGAILVLDEVVQVVDYLMHSDTLNHIRAKVFSHLQILLTTVRETSGTCFTMDADSDRKTLNIIKALGGFTEKDVFSITNTFVHDRGKAYFTNDKVALLNDCLQQVLAGKKVWFCLSAQEAISKMGTTVVEQWFIDRGVSAQWICRVDATTVGDQSHPAYRAASRLPEFTNEFRLYLVSPTLATGCDIQTYDFDFVYSLQSGAQRVDSARQAPERIRDTKPVRIVYAAEQVPWKNESGLTTPSLIADYREAHDQALKMFEPSWFEELEDTSRASIIQAVEEWYVIDAHERWDEKQHYGAKLFQGMRADGYQLEQFKPANKLSGEERQSILEELKVISEAAVVAEMLHRELKDFEKRLNDEEAKECYKNLEKLTPDETAALEAYQIRKRYGLIPTVAVQKALAEGKGQQLENQFDALDGYKLKQQIWQRDHYSSAGKEGSRELTTDFVKRSSRMMRIKALHDVNFFNRILQEFSSEDADQLLTDLRAASLNITLFNLPTSGAYPVKAIRAIAAQFNFKLITVKRSKKGVRTYQAVDEGFILGDSLEDLKPQVFSHFKEKLQKSVDNWKSFKEDYHKVKRGERLDSAVTLPPLSDGFKYAKLSTRAKTLPGLPLQPAIQMVTEANVAAFQEWLVSKKELAIDIETYGEGKRGGLNHLTGKIRLIQFATAGSIWVVEQTNFNLIRNALVQCLANSKQRKIGHNIMFDLRFLRRDFGVLARNCADTMFGSKCLLGDMGAAQITSHSLQQACENFLGVEVDKTEQKSDWGAELTQAQIDYAARDPWLTYLLYQRLKMLTQDPSLLLFPFPKMMAWEAWEEENGFLFAAQQMEDTGYEIDAELFAETQARYQSVRDELMSKWEVPYLPTQKGKLQQFLNDKYGLALNSLGKATAAENLEIPEIKLMQQICACDANLHQLEMIKTQMLLRGGRVKPHFTVLSGTGRTSSGATKIEKCLINLQSLAARVNPVLEDFKLPALKALFKTQLIIDLPASHGRISAELGNDAKALEAYQNDKIDMHCGTAAAVAQAVFPEEHLTADWIQANKKSGKAKGLRDTAKNTYYGWLNGAGVSTIQRQIKSNLQINADRPACQKALEGLQNVFSGTTEFAKSKLKELEENKFVINNIVCGWMEFAGTYLCWKLGTVGGDLKVTATKAFAGIWSRTESLLMKRSCSRIAEKFADMPEWGAKLQNFIHDEINCEIGHPDAATFAHAVVREEFGRICPRTVVGFDPLEKCYPLENWSQK